MFHLKNASYKTGNIYKQVLANIGLADNFIDRVDSNLFSWHQSLRCFVVGLDLNEIMWSYDKRDFKRRY